MTRNRPLHSFFFALLAAACICACGCSSAPPISVSLPSASVQTDQGQTVAIAATLKNDSSFQGVTWTLSGPGSLSGQSTVSATYVIPTTMTTAQTATLTATSLADPTKHASIQITVNLPPRILTGSLPGGIRGSAYSLSLSESGGTSPFTWSVFSGAIPNGLSLNPNTGALSGTPTAGGTWDFEVELTDAAGVTQHQPFLSITINPNTPPGNPIPLLNLPLVPDAAAPGGAGFTLTVNGAGFLSGATVNFNGTALATTFVNSGQLTAVVPAADIASAGTASISVVNPSPGGFSSNPLSFSIATPEPSVSFSEATGSPFGTIYAPLAMTVGDFNGDAKPDLVVAGLPNVSVLLGHGDGTFTQASGSPISMVSPSGATDPGPSAVVVGDFNNDGRLDFAVADFEYGFNNVPVLMGNGDGTFTASTAPGNTNGLTSCALAAADFNSDGGLDLAVGNDIYGRLDILLGYGAGAFSEAANSPMYLSVIGQCSVTVGDLNGDGKLDLAIATQGTNSVTILLGNGDGTFTPATGPAPAVGKQPQAIVAADFNGDGKLDLAIANAADNTVTILLGNGDGTFTQASGSPIAVGTAPYAIVAADFRANGKLDLAIANSGSNNVTLLLGNGDGTFAQAPASPFPVGKVPYSLVVGDFNSSGRAGLAVANSTDSTISILVQ